MSRLSDRTARRTGDGAAQGEACGARARAAVRVPLVQAHLRPAHRRRQRRRRWPRPRRWKRPCAKARKTGANIDAAKAVGKLIAERAKEKGIKDVVFDRGGYLYHGRVKALADAAREGGLNF